ncbi:Gfo/Idh/MocA family oxidoreductase [Streptococcus varani]|uniref:Gfo/Idh/MocA family oxidoreductase n=1 Tax=Streptococcus varani TaxID=1608583 RepID=A0A0E3WER3_9STRE|nr:Gfo/Idh/MocA family oxidoreductase [Streptococcus varani]CQR24151.1 Gfo/Idh/MocA family oxidoreductase [Streptococcus varani]
MTEKKLQFGIIGFGFMGQTHAKMITEDLDYADVVAVCDINKMQLEHADASYKTYLTADELLKEEAIDTVIIAVPNHLHLEMVEKTARAGKDIICEKPAGMNAQEVEKMLEVTKEAGVRFTFHHQRRWDTDYNVAKKVYESGELGNIYTIKSSLYGFNGNMHDWHVYPEFGGGMLYDWGVHLIDQILNMVPVKLKQIYAHVENVINENVDDYFNLQFYFENGVNAQIELGTYFLSDKESWFEHNWFLAGNKGTAYSDGFFPQGKIVTTSELLTNVPGKITMTHAGPTRSFGPAPEGRIITKELPSVDVNHGMFFENYYQNFLGQEELVIKPEQILRLMRVVDAIRLSAKTHKSVDFE